MQQRFGARGVRSGQAMCPRVLGSPPSQAIGSVWAKVVCVAISLALSGVFPAKAEERTVAPTVHVVLPVQPLGDSLRTLAAQTQTNILFDRSLVDDRQGMALDDFLSLGQALDALLEGTGLGYRMTDGRTVVIVREAAGATPAAAPAAIPGRTSQPLPEAALGRSDGTLGENEAAPGEESAAYELERLVVTGSRLRGINPPVGNLQIIGRAEIERGGYTSLPDVLRSVVQNYSGASGGLSASGIAMFNADYGNILRKEGVNLRGLGSGASLVLLDGRRLPVDSGKVDLSTIPVAAIERIEILRDGSSALYGADAVAGVVNIILRKHYVGHEISASLGGTEAGGASHLGWSHTTGLAGTRGSATITVQRTSEQALLAEQRPYVGDLSHFMLRPESTLTSGAFHGQLDSGVVHGWLRVLRSEREVSSAYLREGMLNHYEGQLTDQSASLGVDWDPGERLSLALVGSLGENQSTSQLEASAPGFAYGSGGRDRFVVRELELTATGTLPLPQHISYAAGVGRRAESFRKSLFDREGIPTSDTLYQSRGINFLYAEALVPLLGSDGDQPPAVDLTLAARRDLFSTSQSATSPMATLRWNPLPGLTVSLRHAESFRPPTLEQELASTDPMSNSTVLDLERYTGPDGTPVSTILLSGISPALAPETSVSRSLSISYAPRDSWIKRLGVSAFVTDYRDKLEAVPFSLTVVRDYLDKGGVVARLTPEEAAQIIAQGLRDSFLYNSDTGEIGAFNGDPAAYQYLVDMRTRNMASIRTDGADLDLDMAWDREVYALRGQLSLGYVRSYRTRLTSDDVGVEVVRTMFRPQRWKGRGSVELDWGRYTASLAAHYTDRYYDLRTGVPLPVESWMTFDLGLGARVGAESSTGAEWRAALHIDNLTDRRPPGILPVEPFPVRYDASAANPLGRAYKLSISRTW